MSIDKNRTFTDILYFIFVFIVVFFIRASFGQTLVGTWKLASALYNNQPLSNVTGSITITEQLGYSAMFNDGINRGDVSATLTKNTSNLTSNLNGNSLALNGYSMEYYFSGGKMTMAWSAIMSCSRTVFNQYGGTAILYGTNKYTLENNFLTITSLNGSTILKYSLVLVPKLVKIPLSQGWNLVSWNVDTVNDSTKVLLKDIIAKVNVVLGYENGGFSYDPKLVNVSTLPFMDHFHGYWIKMLSGDTLRLSGMPVDFATTNIPCETGWNLVSYLPTQHDSTSHGFSSVINNLTVALGYNGTGQTYVPQLCSFSTLTVLAPSMGYWLRLNQPSNLRYPQPLSGINPMQEPVPMITKSIGEDNKNLAGFLYPSNEWINLYGQNIIHHGRLLAVGTEVKAKDREGNECGSFIVRQAGVFGFMPVYRDDPNTEVDEGAKPDEEINLYFGDEKVPVTLKWTEMGEAINVAEKMTGVQESYDQISTSYTLSQNHPNPFNPQTTISYQLPRDLHVTIKVYNTLGQEIATLLDQTIQAGYHQVVWNGRDHQGNKAASALYLYTMTTGEFAETKKMLLLY